MTTATALPGMIERSLIDRSDVVSLRETIAKLGVSRSKRRVLNDRLAVHELSGTVFDIRKLFQQTGAWRVNNNEISSLSCSFKVPTIAIAGVKDVYATFRTRSMSFKSETARDVYIGITSHIRDSWDLGLRVPFIPKGLMPRWGTRNRHYILFDAPHWEGRQVVEDPYILERVSDHEFRVISHWDLTENEKRLLAFASQS